MHTQQPSSQSPPKLVAKGLGTHCFRLAARSYSYRMITCTEFEVDIFERAAQKSNASVQMSNICPKRILQDEIPY